MILVVIGHVIQIGSNGIFDIFSNPVFVTIYFFHMPLFIFISGYLAERSLERHSTISIVRNRSRQLLVPIASWVLTLGVVVGLVEELRLGAFNVLQLIRPRFCAAPMRGAALG